MESIWERTPDRRKPIENVSSQDWMLRFQKLKSQNASLESERDYYKQLYEKSVEAKEEVRKKAKDAVQVMRAIYTDYEELQVILKDKEHTIFSLKETIKTLEQKLITQSQIVDKGTIEQNEAPFTKPRRAVQMVDDGESFQQPVSNSSQSMSSNGHGNHNNSSSTTIQFDEEIFNATPKRSKPVDSMSTPAHHDSRQDEDQAEECAMLRARVAELEGFLVGTLYHSATKATPHRISEKELAPFTPAKRIEPNSAISKMIDALHHAAGSSVPNTPDDIANKSADMMEGSRLGKILDSFDRAMTTPLR